MALAPLILLVSLSLASAIQLQFSHFPLVNIRISLHFIIIIIVSLQVPADSPLSLPLHPSQTSSGARPTGRPGLVSLEVDNN